MGKLFYILFVKLYPLGARIAALLNNKAKLWVDGRKNIFTTIQQKLAGDKSNRIWIHCSSLGEFEQGRPLMEALKNKESSCSFALCFVSSGR